MPRAGRDCLAMTYTVSEMFCQSKLKISKTPKYFRLGQMKHFSCVLLVFFFKFSFRNLSYSKLNEFFLPFLKCLKKYILKSEKGEGIFSNRKFLKLIVSPKKVSILHIVLGVFFC